MIRNAMTVWLLMASLAFCQQKETLPALNGKAAPQNFSEMWAGFDPRAEPLETEILHEWEEDDVVLKIVRFRIGVFKGKVARLAAVFGYPKSADLNNEKLPGLLQIHGGGQYADHKACLMNAKRGYATLSIAWAGRISSPGYRVTPPEVKLFWDNKTDDPRYRVTTDWGAVDGYHAPSRHPKNNFPSAKSADWTLDPIESPRNSPWFLCALAARRGLTFLERHSRVDADRLGVYGHSMGGKLTVMMGFDARVKAAAPSCGGISDRTNSSELFRRTVGDDVSLPNISCPIMFLSPSNDFHGRLGDLPSAIRLIKSKQWRVTCSPHHNHQDSAEYEVATLLWFDQHLRHKFQIPQTPETKLQLKTADGTPTISIHPDSSREILSVDVYYTQQGKPNELPADHFATKSRFWRHAAPLKNGDTWNARIPLISADRPLWVFANVLYSLPETVAGAGYYYGAYETKSFNLSSVVELISPDELAAANVKAELESTQQIETFADGWQKEWFSYRPESWPRSTHKLSDPQYKAPDGARLAIDVRCEQPNTLVVLVDDLTAVAELAGGPNWQPVELRPMDFQNFEGEPRSDWNEIHTLKLSDVERLRAPRGKKLPSKIVGRKWRGTPPEFRNLRWVVK